MGRPAQLGRVGAHQGRRDHRRAPLLQLRHRGAVPALRRPRRGRPPQPPRRRAAAGAAAAARHGVHRALRDPQRLPAVLGPRADRPRRLPTEVPPRPAVAVRGDPAARPRRRGALVRGRADLRAALDQRLRGRRHDRPRRLPPGRSDAAAGSRGRAVGRAQEDGRPGVDEGAAAALALRPAHRPHHRGAAARSDLGVPDDRRPPRRPPSPLRLRDDRAAGVVPVRRPDPARHGDRRAAALALARRRLRQRVAGGAARRRHRRGRRLGGDVRVRRPPRSLGVPRLRRPAHQRRPGGAGPPARAHLERHPRLLGPGQRAARRRPSAAVSSDALILDGRRTPRGKGSPRGALHAVPPLRLVTGLLDALVARGVAPAAVDDLLLGCATQVDDQGADLARTAALVAGWDAVPGATINRFCASGLDAVAVAAARIRAGDAALIVAGGVESTSRVPIFSDRGPLYADPEVAAIAGSVHMGIAADLIATIDRRDRAELDAYAAATRARARAAWADGRAAASVEPVRRDGAVVIEHDELLDHDPTPAQLAALPPAFAEAGAAGQDVIALARHPAAGAIRHLHTRASSPALADGAALLVLGDAATAARLGLRPRARVAATVTCADDPVLMLTAGQTAVERLLARAGLRAADVDVFGFAEAFAALCLRFQGALGCGADRFNPDGGTIAMGHAFGATGAILALDVVDQLEQRGGRWGVAAVSGAAGVGVAALIERLP
ncbi:MAG: acetyl-CoA C-acyltransferase [Kofleriaceae bacterium]|nr:acetyl-CoA C-acyltransferase [Kofleriaceae bacterium]MCB9573389.1 acetyl-CoA C-acyltransferase [Kofleriaceae bacterium]